MARLLRATCGGADGRVATALTAIGADSTDVILAVADDSLQDFLPGLVAMAWAAAPPGGQGIPEVVQTLYDHQDALEALFVAAVAGQRATSAENARELGVGFPLTEARAKAAERGARRAVAAASAPCAVSCR